MSTTKITSSSSSCYLKSNGRTCNNHHIMQSQPYNISTIKIKRARKVDHDHLHFLKFSAKYGFSLPVRMPSNFQVKASSNSPKNSSSSWKKWLLGILLTVILPALGHKGGLLVGLKGKIDKAIETMDHVAEVVEEIAEEAEKIVEEVEEKLPGDSKLKESLESFEALAKEAVTEAKKADDLIHKVKDLEEEIESAMIKAGRDQAKK